MSRLQIWTEWMALKDDIQCLASVVQNEITMSEEDWQLWLLQVDNFKVKFEALKLATMRQVK